MYARSRLLRDPRILDTLGPAARFVHLDCTVSPIPDHLPVGKEIADIWEASPAAHLAFGVWFATNSRGDAVYGVRDCLCQSLTGMRNGADLLRERGSDHCTVDLDWDLPVIEMAVERFHTHASLRRRVSQGSADPAEQRAFESRLRDELARRWSCRRLDSARASILTIGCLPTAGGDPVGLERVLDPEHSTSPEARTMLLAAMTSAALRTDPVPEQNGPHLAMAYLLLAQDEIVPAVTAACDKQGCAPENLPLHALPVPLAARERLAVLVCRSRAIAAETGRDALAALAAM